MSPLNFFEDYHLDCNKCQLKALSGPCLFRILLVLFSLKRILCTNSIDHGFSHIKHTSQGPSVPKRNFSRLFWTLSAINISQTGSIFSQQEQGSCPINFERNHFQYFWKLFLCYYTLTCLIDKHACLVHTYYVQSSMLAY